MRICSVTCPLTPAFHRKRSEPWPHLHTELGWWEKYLQKATPPHAHTIKRLICGSCFIIRHYVHEVIKKNHCFPNFLSLSFPSKKQNKSVPSLEPVWLSACRGIYRNSAFDCLWYHKSSPASLSPKLLLTTSRLVITVALCTLNMTKSPQPPVARKL